MALTMLDTTGLRCPKPVLKLAVEATKRKPGDVLEIIGNCPTFEKDIRTWCDRLGRVVLSVRETDGSSAIRIQF